MVPKGEYLAACVEGFLLRNNKYYPKGAADAICNAVSEESDYSRKDCMNASNLTQYDMARSVARYVVA